MSQQGNVRHGSLVIPILLIFLGAILLYSTWHPAFDPWPILMTYWPLLLVFVGLGMLLDVFRQRGSATPARRFPLGSTIGVLIFILVLGALFHHGRRLSREFAGSPHMNHVVQALDRQGAQSVRAALEMGSGELTLSGGASRLFEGDFNFGSSYGEPRVEYSVSKGMGQLNLSQDNQSLHIGRSQNDWNLRFASDVPLDLKIHMGAGQGNLRLRDVNITDLELNIGAGEVNVDLTGDRKSDLKADIEGGVGQANIRLPKHVGVVVNASGGIGTIDAHDLKHEDGEYTNEAYSKSPATIHLTVHGGIGAIRLIQEP